MEKNMEDGMEARCIGLGFRFLGEGARIWMV